MKLFKNVVLLNLDGVPDKAGDFFDKSSKISWVTGPMYILDQPGKGWPIGEVKNIRVENDQLLCDLEFTADQSSLQMQMYPTFSGKNLNSLGNHILEAKLMTVDMSHYNSDHRIPKLEAYLTQHLVSSPYGFGLSHIDLSIEIDHAVVKKECRCESLIHGHSDGCSWTK